MGKIFDISKFKKNSEDKLLLTFLDLLTKLEPIETIGIARLANISLIEGEKSEIERVEDIKPRDFNEVLSEIIDYFIKLNKENKKGLIKLLKATQSEK